MHELLIIKMVVCRGEFHHIAEVVAYLFKILILINFENISVAIVDTWIEFNLLSLELPTSAETKE